jgi:hypothetical protein
METPILRSAWVCGLGLELTYQNPFAQQRRANCSGTELSPAVDYDSSPEGAVVKVNNELEVRSVVVPTQHGSS